jgi:hypothetical protein
MLVLALVAISSLTSTTALPTHSPETASPVSSLEPLDTQADDGDYTWLSYTEKMALGVFGRFPGLEGECSLFPHLGAFDQADTCSHHPSLPACALLLRSVYARLPLPSAVDV